MAINKRLISYPVASAADTNLPSEYFNTVLYTGNGGSQRVGGYINRGFISKSSTAGVEIPNVENLFQRKDTEYSVSVWFNGTPNAYAGEIFSDYAYESFSSYIYIDPSGYLKAEVRMNFSPATITSSAVVNDGEWHHIVYTYNISTNTAKLYLDGAFVSSVTIPSSAYYSSSGSNVKITFGSVWYPPTSSYSNGLNGVIDHARIFDREVTSSEVTTLYGETYASTTISTTDIFSDGSGVALYQFDGNANDTGGVNGKFGAAAIFNGSSSKITVSTSATTPVDFTSENFSISLWFKADSLHSGALIGKWSTSDGTGRAILLHTNANGTFTLSERQGTSPFNLTTTSTYAADTWNHFVYVRNATQSILYLNNVSETDSRTNSINSGSTTELAIGHQTGGFKYFNGTIDDIRIYSDTLTSTEVGYIYNNTTASIPTDNLEAYYKLDGNALDSANSFDGTESNITYGYDGTGSVSYQEATNFTPDLVWIAKRNIANYSHPLFDSVRGLSQPQAVYSDRTLAESNDGMVSFDTNGFSINNVGNINRNDDTFVAWCFNAGTVAAALNQQGSIDSTVKANTGFSIVSYTGNLTSTTTSTGASVGHGLSSPPELIIFKNLDTAENWGVFSSELDNWATDLHLNTSDLKNNFYSTYPIADPTSDVFYTNYLTSQNVLNDDYIAYCFHSVDGIQKVGSYQGTGATGNLVETSFEPAFVMIKETGNAGSWHIYDNERPDSGGSNRAYLLADTSNYENEFGAFPVSFKSNGFSVDNTGNGTNRDGGNYIYLAIAADPDTTTPVVENSFDVVTYTGNGGTQDIDVAFKPDLVWIKAREASGNNLIQDTIRGTAHQVYSNLTFSTTTSTGITAFNTNGFTLSDNANGDSNVNGSAGGTYSGSNAGYVAWCWKAGDHDDNLPEINTNGTTDSIVSVNDAAGFSIVKYSGSNSNATIGHGLSSPPEFIMVKNISSTNNWCGSSQYIGWNNIFGFDYNLQARDFDFFLDTPPTSQVFNVKGNIGLVNDAGEDYIAYCFKSITGYQKLGSYSGTGVDGNRIYTTDDGTSSGSGGFEPRWLLVKRTDAADNWVIVDTARGLDGSLFPDLNSQELSNSNVVSFNSDGFTVNGASGGWNNGSGTYFYLAIK